MPRTTQKSRLRAVALGAVMPLAAIATATALPASAQASNASPVCATPAQRVFIQDYYTAKRPGVPLPVPSRYFEVPEFVVASALPADISVGTAASPDVVRTVWSSIEAWGADSKVTLVISPTSQHAFAFPSLVPVQQPNPNPGYISVYADSGNGVHSHLQLNRVAAIYAVDLPTDKPEFRTRGVSFFGADGHLIVGVYASIREGAFEQRAVDGFAATQTLIRSMPRLCQ